MRKKYKAPPEIKYWCVVGIVKQDAFREDGSVYQLEIEHPVGEQHLVHQGVLMCRSARETLKNKLKAKKHKEVSQRIINVPLCKKCEKKYKENGDLAWQKWAATAKPEKPIAEGLKEAFREVFSESLHGVK